MTTPFRATAVVELVERGLEGLAEEQSLSELDRKLAAASTLALGGTRAPGARTELVLDALEMANGLPRPDAG